MRTLTEVFAPGEPPLPEGLRTLVVSPDRIVEPGVTVRATFAFYNMGGAAATGLRVRFTHPDGLRYIVGSAKIDDQPLDEPRGEATLLSANGADIGDVPPGVERRISVSFVVAPTIENGRTIALQAALASYETDVIGSNVVTLTARSRPDLGNPATVASIEAVRVAEPGEDVRIAARIYNAGQSSAHELTVVLPVPDRTTYVVGSARIDGRPVVTDDRGDPFGFAHAPIAATSLSPGATLTVEYRATIDSPLDNDTKIFVYGAVAAEEVPEFELARAELTVRSAARFDDERTALFADAEGDVEPGRRIRIALAGYNAGTCAAEDVKLRLELPDGLRYAPGSRSIDGRSVGESDTSGLFTFERVPAGERLEVSLDAYVVSPAVDGGLLRVLATLAYDGGSRAFDRAFTVRAEARFSPARNTLALDGSSSVVPGSIARFLVTLVNDGTTSTSAAQVLLTADAGLGILRFLGADGEESRVQNNTIDLGELAPNASREIVLLGTVATPIADRAELRVSAELRTREGGTLGLGTVTLVTRSRPRFSPQSSRLALVANESLRPNRSIDIAVAIENEGTDVARDLRLTLDLPADLRIESVDGATRSGDAILFGDVPAGARADATLRVRLTRFVPRGSAISLGGRISGVGLLPFSVDPLTIPTLAEADFAHNASLRTQPFETVDAGEPMYFVLAVRNTGDGPAARVTVRVALPEHTAYVPGSTAVNDVPLLDSAGGSVLWSKNGLALEDVGPGVEILARWCAIVNTPLVTGTLIAAHADVQWDGIGATQVSSAVVRVRSTPQFAVRANGLPFSVAGVAPRASDFVHEPEYVPGSLPAAPIPLPRPFPVAARPEAPTPPPPAPVDAEDARFAPAGVSEPSLESASPARAVVVANDKPTDALPPPAPLPPISNAVFVSHLDLSRESVERSLAFIDQADYGGLVSHLFVVRSFFPEGVYGLDGEVTPKFGAERDALRSVLDRLFIKLRLPRYALTAKDLEDRSSRNALMELVGAMRSARSTSDAVPPQDVAVRISGAIDRDRIVSRLTSLESEPLGSALPWLVLAEFLGTTITVDGAASDALGTYRTALIAAFANVSALPLEEFHRVLAESSNPGLDAKLADVKAALRASLEATATVSDAR